ISDMAVAYMKAIKVVQPKGPYYLLGYSMGGTLVYEIAHLLGKDKEVTNLLALIDSWAVFSELHQNKKYFIYELKETTKELTDSLISLAWERMELLLQHKLSHTNQDVILFKAVDLMEE